MMEAGSEASEVPETTPGTGDKHGRECSIRWARCCSSNCRLCSTRSAHSHKKPSDLAYAQAVATMKDTPRPALFWAPDV
ncbi:hypothetical protein C8Q80DRAFT_766002 [Daedaleopsis nitida]|nr:hypothetical protein C8Q80DRAFT_766002 [Daedaleopsis nitida]